MKNFTNNSLKKELSLQVQSMKKVLLTRNENTLKKLTKSLAIFALFFIFSIQAKASHMMGADLTYRLISSTNTTYTYQITMTLYRACSGIDFTGGTVLVTGGNYSATPFAMTQQGGDVEVTPICKPPDVPTATPTNCPGPNTPTIPPDNLKGCMRRIYTKTFVLPKNSGSYIFYFSECCRNNINTITTSPDLYVQCVLTTDGGYANSSPIFTNPPIPYWCKNSPQTYNHGTVDSFDQATININGLIVPRDSFSYIIYAPWIGPNGVLSQQVKGNNPSVTFVSPLNATNFLHTTGGVSLDYKTGSISCTPNTSETAIMAMRVDEWRAVPAPGGGYTRVNIGHIVRDIQFTVGDLCKPITNVGVLADSLFGNNRVAYDEIDICGRVAVEGVIKIVGPPTANMKFDTRLSSIHIPDPNNIANFTYVVNKQSTNTVDTLFINYKFDSTKRDYGNEVFSFITYYCTSTGIKIEKNYSLKIHFTKAVRVKNPKLYYCISGAPARSYATGVDSGGSYTWYPTAGIVGSSGPDSNWVDLAPPTSRFYWVRGKTGIDSTKSCTVVDSVFVTVIQPFTYTITPTVADLCLNDTVMIKINPKISDTPYTYVWTEPFANSLYNSATNQNSKSLQNPTIRAYGNGDYNVTITSKYGCVLNNKVTVNIKGLRTNITANSGRSIICPGDTTLLWTTVKPTKVALSFFPTVSTNTTHTMPTPSPEVLYPTSSGFPNPIGVFGAGGSMITRVIYTQAQLLAMGAYPGVIKSLSLKVNTNNYDLDEFYIKAAGVSTTNATPFNMGALYTVYNPRPLTLGVGWQEFVFDNPLDWDGVSNIMFEFHTYKTSTVSVNNIFSALNTPASQAVAYKYSTTAGQRAESIPGNFTSPTGIVRCIPLLQLKMARIDSSSTTYLNTVWTPAANVTQGANPIAIGRGNQIDTIFTATTGTAQCNSTSNVIVRPDNGFKVVGKGDTVICLTSGSTSIPLSAVITSTGTPTVSWTSIPPDPSMTVTNQANITVSPTKGTWKYIVTATSLPCSAVDTVYVTVNDSLYIDLKVDSPKCTSNTGKLTAILPSASTPNQYNYTWTPNPSSSTNDTLKNVSAGLYTLSVTLKSNPLCGGSVRKTVSPSIIVIPVNTLSSGINCFGGTADSIYAIINSPQTTGPYTYLWSPGGGTSSKITNKAIGTYSVTVTDTKTSCTGTSTYILNQPTKLSLSATSTPVRCKGEQNGTVSATSTGGTPSVQFFWTSTTGKNLDMNNIPAAVGLFADSFKVVAIDDNGCKDSIGIRVNEPALPLTVTMSKINATVVGGSDGSVTGTAIGGTPNYSFVWSNSITQNNLPSASTISGLPKGIYKVTVTDSKGCVTLGQDTVLDVICNMKPHVLIDSVKCYGASTGKITFSAIDSINYAQTTWYKYIISTQGGSAFDSVVMPNGYPTNHIFSSLKQGNYNIQIKTSKGCDTTITDLNVEQNPDMFINYSPKAPSCLGYSNGEIHVAVSIDKFRPFNYQFDPAVGYITDSFDKNRKSGSGQVFWVRDNLGCIKQQTYNLDTPKGITTSFTLIDSVTCFGMKNAQGRVDVLPANPLKPYIYKFKPGSDQDTFSNLVKNVGAISDSVIIIYQCDTCTKTCIETQRFTITEPTKLVLNTTATDVTCSYNKNGTVVATSTGGNGSNNFSVKNFNSNVIVKPSQVSSTFDSLDSGKFKVYVVDRKGCIDSNTLTINKPDTFKVFLKVIDASCPEVSNGKVEVDQIKGGNTTSTYGYSWTKTNQGGQTTTEGNSASITAAQGLNTYKLTITDAKNCIASNSIFVDTIYTLQILSATIDSAKCFGSTDGSVRITKMYPASAPMPYNYAWSNGSTTNPMTAGKGSYTATVTDGNGCKATGVYAIEQPADILITGNILHASCFGSFTGSVKINISGGHAPYVSQWATNPTQFTDSAVDLPSGVNNVVVTDNNGCVKNASFTIQQPSALTAKIVDVKNVTCNAAKNGSMAVGVTGGVYKYRYAWNNVTSTDSAIQNLGPSDKYIVTVTDDNGCTTTATSSITEPTKLEFEDIKVDSVSCPKYDDGSIDIYAKGGTISSSKQYEYSIDGGNTYVVGNKFPNLPAGIYNVSVRDNNNCIAVRKINVGTPEELFVQAKRMATDSLKMGASDTIYFTKSTSSGIIPNINSVQWTPNNGLTCGSCESTQATPFVSTTYDLEVRYHNNCLVKSSVIVPVLPSMDIFVPSAFTPGNQDLVNDVLYVYGNGIKTVVFRIYDRWGEKVFESNSMKNGWDGMYKGDIAPNGVYSYQVQVEYLNGDKKNKHGSITLIR